MRNIEKGSGLIGLILAIVIIVALVFGYRQLGKDSQIKKGNDAIEGAEDAARLQREHDLNLQSEIESSGDIDYWSVQNKATNSLKQLER
jgi:hypothetical protein